MKKIFLIITLILLLIPFSEAEASRTTISHQTANVTIRERPNDVHFYVDPKLTMTTTWYFNSTNWRWSRSSISPFTSTYSPPQTSIPVASNAGKDANNSLSINNPANNTGVWYLHLRINMQGYRNWSVTHQGIYITRRIDFGESVPTPIGIFYWEPFTQNDVTRYRWDIESEVVVIPGYEEEVEVEVTYEVRKGTVGVSVETYLTE